MSRSTIEWTNATWNPVTGCTKTSPGCKHCYAERMARRLQAMGQANYARGFQLTLQEHMLDIPLRWRKPRLVFVNSMSDLFHKDVPTSFIQRVFRTMEQAPQHTFQVLTKRADRLGPISYHGLRPSGMGVSVENADYLGNPRRRRSRAARLLRGTPGARVTGNLHRGSVTR